VSEPTLPPQRSPLARAAKTGATLVALVLAVGMATALNLFCVAVLWDAISSAGPGLSENATQILTGWGGGIIGILGTVFGYTSGASHARASQDTSHDMS